MIMIIDTNKGMWSKRKSDRRKKLKAERKALRKAKKKAREAGIVSKPVHKRPGRKIDPFYHSKAWILVRYKVLVRDKGICQCCGRSAKDGVVMNVDHIKPKWKYPELALDENNLQTLCSRCNSGKWGVDETDWRDPLEAEFKAVIG